VAEATEAAQLNLDRAPSASSLRGKRILITRTREQAGQLAERLAELGAEPIELPTIQVIAPSDWGPVDNAIESLDEFSWLVFTSVNGVRYFFQRLAERGHRPARLAAARLVAVGPATSAALGELGLRPNLVPARSQTEGIVDELRRFDLRGSRVLLLRARNGRELLVSELTALGARVTDVAVYETMPTGDPTAVRLLLASAGVDAVTFTSSSTARNLVALLAEENERQLRSVVVASIGPITSQTARELGLTVQIEANEPTVPALIAALERYFDT
jgi:uroporphyrinogen III methyltransferase / synthase